MPVHGQHRPGVDLGSADADHCRNTEAPGEDRGVRRGASDLGDERQRHPWRDRDGFGGSEIIGDDHGRLGQMLESGVSQAEQLANELGPDVPQVCGPGSEVLVADVLELRRESIGHLCHGGFRTQTVVSDQGESVT